MNQKQALVGQYVLPHYMHLLLQFQYYQIDHNILEVRPKTGLFEMESTKSFLNTLINR